MSNGKRPAATAMERFWELIASRTSKLKARIEAVQCTAIDVRLTLMEDEAVQKPNRITQARQHIADELRCAANEIESLLADIRVMPSKSERTRLH